MGILTSLYYQKRFNTPYRLDRNSNGGELLVYVCFDIPSKCITDIGFSIECMFIEINLRKKK